MARDARALSEDEIEELTRAFVEGARRAERAGFDGVEVHGAHGYLFTQFLSPTLNRRSDRFGGPLENRSRFLLDVSRRVRAACGPDFILGVRLSPERFGLELSEMREVAIELVRNYDIEFLDVSLWDFRKAPEEDDGSGRDLMDYFTDFDRGDVRLGVSGKIQGARDVQEALERGGDFAFIGKGAIVHHDFPRRVRANDSFVMRELPVSPDVLTEEGVSPAFIHYLRDRLKLVRD